MEEAADFQTKKQMIFFNKSDLLDKDETKKKLMEFEKKIKSKYEVISLFSKTDLEKIKKKLIRYASK